MLSVSRISRTISFMPTGVLDDDIARPNWMFTVGRACIKPTLMLRYRPLVTGREHVPKSGPVLLASNHLGSLDTILIPSFAPRTVQFLAKASLFRGRFRNWVMRSIGAVPVYREAGSEAQAALEAGKRVLEAGGVFAVFPEGSRSRTGLLNRGRTGAAWLAMESGAAVIPVGLIGTDRKPSPATGRKPRVQIAFGPAIDTAGLDGLPQGQARREMTERIMAGIQALSGQKRSDTYAGGRGA